MGYINYEQVFNKYSKNDFVMHGINMLKKYDYYHLLRDSSIVKSQRIADTFGGLSSEYLAWMSVCGGGYLFDTVLLSIEEYDNELDLSFDTLQELNAEESKNSFGIPNRYFIIAIRSYGDPICLSRSDKKVHLWDCEEGRFTAEWESFYDFLIDEISSSLELIANGDLFPIPIKVPDDEMI